MCRLFALRCQEPIRRSGTDLILFSSEVAGGLGAEEDNGWTDLRDGEYVFVDANLELRHASL